MSLSPGAGNHTVEAVKPLMMLGVDVVRCGGNLYRELLLGLPKAGTNIIGEVIGWPNIAKFLFYTCLNEVTRMMLYEIVKFIRNNYVLF